MCVCVCVCAPGTLYDVRERKEKKKCVCGRCVSYASGAVDGGRSAGKEEVYGRKLFSLPPLAGA